MKEIKQGDIFTTTAQANGRRDDCRTYELLSAERFIVKLVKPSKYQRQSDTAFRGESWTETAENQVEPQWFTERGFAIV